MFNGVTFYNNVADSIGNFYTDDISVLNEIKKEWAFKSIRHQPYWWNSGGSYIVFIRKNGIVIEEINANLSWPEYKRNFFDHSAYYPSYNSRGRYYNFVPGKVGMFKSKLKQPIKEVRKFEDVYEARAYRNKALKDSNFLTSDLYNSYSLTWINCEGKFYFLYPRSKGHWMEKQVSEEIKKAFPNDFFEVDWTDSLQGADSGFHACGIYCDKTLYNKFNLYPIKNEWMSNAPFQITTYWKRKPDY